MKREGKGTDYIRYQRAWVPFSLCVKVKVISATSLPYCFFVAFHMTHSRFVPRIDTSHCTRCLSSRRSVASCWRWVRWVVVVARLGILATNVISIHGCDALISCLVLFMKLCAANKIAWPKSDKAVFVHGGKGTNYAFMVLLGFI